MKEKKKNILKENLGYIITILLIIMIRIFIITPIMVDGDSMNNTLKNKEVVILKKFDKSYERFEIVVFKHENSKLIKRIIGLPGEHVKIKDNKLYINDKEVEENMITFKTKDFDLSQLGFEVIPDNYYFVLGDNRNNSKDSRYFGLIKKSDIIGTTDFVIFPLNKIRKIK